MPSGKVSHLQVQQAINLSCSRKGAIVLTEDQKTSKTYERKVMREQGKREVMDGNV